MGIYGRIRFRFAIRRRESYREIRDQVWTGQRRWALAWCGVATSVSVAAAILWSNWFTVHCVVILSGLLASLCCAPWVAERDELPPLVVKSGSPEPLTGRSAARRRAA